MNHDGFDREDDKLESTWDRWQHLPLAYRVNAGLYVLGFLSLVALLVQVVSGTGDKPRQVEVASRAPSTTKAPRVTTTTKVPATTVAPAPPAANKPSVGGAGRPTGGTGSGSSRPAPGAAVPDATAPPDTLPIPGLDTLGCNNSTEPRCGPFRWEPHPGSNMPIVINVQRVPSFADVGETVTFSVTVSDADHPVSDNCAVIDFGDGVTQHAPCQPLVCPETFGPWNPPARSAGSATFEYTHVYATPGTYTPTFEFHSDRDRCPDPYGNFGRGTTTVTISEPGT